MEKPYNDAVCLRAVAAGLNALFGWWADPMAGLLMVPIIVKRASMESGARLVAMTADLQ